METTNNEGNGRSETMTRTQRNAIKKIDGATITSARKVEIFIADETGDRADSEATEAVKAQVQEIINWGGYRNGFGGWVLQAGYSTDGLDYCDSSSQLHY